MGELPGAQGATIVDQGSYEELVSRGRDLSIILDQQQGKRDRLSTASTADASSDGGFDGAEVSRITAHHVDCWRLTWSGQGVRGCGECVCLWI